MKTLLTPVAITVIGLVLDMIGVLILYRYGLPPRTKPPPKELREQGFSVDVANRLILQSEPEAASGPPLEITSWYDGQKRRHKRWSGIALALLCAGFGLQGIAALMK